MNTTSSSAKRADSVSNTSTRPPRLLDLLRERIRYKHYSLRTEQAYVHWVRAFIRQQGMRHPRDMGAAEVEQFLCWLANERNVAPSTHNQALSALLFLYREVLDVDLPWMNEIGRPKKGNRGQTTVFLTLRNFPRKTGVCPRYPGARLEMPHGLARRLPDDWIAPNGAIGEWLLARAGSSTPGADREVEVRFRFIPLSGSFGPHEERQPFQRCRNAGLR